MTLKLYTDKDSEAILLTAENERKRIKQLLGKILVTLCTAETNIKTGNM